MHLYRGSQPGDLFDEYLTELFQYGGFGDVHPSEQKIAVIIQFYKVFIILYFYDFIDFFTLLVLYFQTPVVTAKHGAGVTAGARAAYALTYAVKIIIECVISPFM